MLLNISLDTENENPVFVKSLLDTLALRAPGETKEPERIKEPKETAKRGKKLQELAAAPAEQPAEQLPAPAEAAAGESGPTLSIVDVREIVDKLIVAGKQESVRKIFDTFNAATVSGLDKQHYSEVVKQLKELL